MSDEANSDCEALIVGAGFSGVYLLHRLREAGFDARLIDAAEEPGGIWYWNCYPGARVDSQVPLYELSLPELWRDWTWSGRYPGWRELRAYFRHVCDRLGLWPHMTMGTRIAGAEWNEGRRKWRVTTGGGETITARYLLPCLGFAAKAYVPEIAGLETLAGEWHHTAHWPQQGLSMAGRKVAIVGTGASGVQVAQEAAAEAAQVTLLQRTPILALPMRQESLTAEQQEREKADYPAIFAARLQTGGGFDTGRVDASALEVDEEERHSLFERQWQAGGLRYWYANFADLLTDERASRYAYDFWRDKTRARIANPALHETLAPSEPPHPFGTKRPSLERNYYEIFSQENVALVDLSRAPIQRIVPEGIETADGLIECELIVFATGFDAGRGGLTQIEIRGRDGRSLTTAWHDEVTAYLGYAVHGFPNMAYLYGPLSPSGFSNGPTAAEIQGDWVRDLLVKLREDNFTRFEAEIDAEREWTESVASIGTMTLFPRAKSWYMGDNIPGKPRQLLNYPSVVGFATISNKVAADGYRGFTLA
ncbi:MAG: flavin-containing monooxygenase [Blastomonas fulva]|uniref:flavin-containing monooxygenase n=1 Tax=Alphaproteobacteria TaxID=28211 RepID=UPI0006B96845|nr:MULTISPECIES: NAD(P)/FAD-dependent oxidoreductase [unclassified Blastomonas]KPF73334.1 cyclopentanone 1,2-monooxygenase [Blastomonas sp. AAP25]MCO5795234.1 NAD(P)/FAD-dependent oxidoreductase [Blastomonas sp.]